MDMAGTRPGGVVIAFPKAASRQTGSSPIPRDETGGILLFTGIRYERPVASDEDPRPLLAGGPGGRRRP